MCKRKFSYIFYFIFMIMWEKVLLHTSWIFGECSCTVAYCLCGRLFSYIFQRMRFSMTSLHICLSAFASVPWFRRDRKPVFECTPSFRWRVCIFVCHTGSKWDPVHIWSQIYPHISSKLFRRSLCGPWIVPCVSCRRCLWH